MQADSDNGRRLVATSTPGIYKRGDRYVVRYRDPQGRGRKRFARTLAEARELRATLTADVKRGEYRALSAVTFADYAAHGSPPTRVERAAASGPRRSPTTESTSGSTATGSRPAAERSRTSDGCGSRPSRRQT